MKINSVISSLNFYNGSYVKKTAQTNPINGSQAPQIKELSNVFYYPISFAAKTKRTNETVRPELKEKSGNFLISRFNDIPCPACGRNMMNRNLYDKIEQDLSEIEPDQYLEHIGKYKQYMRPVEESVYNELVELSEKEDDKDVRSLVCKLREQKLPQLQKIQQQQVKKMRILARMLPEEEKAVVLEKATGLEKIIFKTNSESPFRRKIMLDGISKISISNPKKKKKLEHIAQEFPVSSDMDSAWIVKYSGKNKKGEDYSSKDITLRLIYSSVANTDHILAYDIENNHNDISNYISMHNGCNSLKSNKTFLQWLNEDKENRIGYLQRYFESVDKLIKGRQIKNKKYKNYVAYATETIADVSKGQVLIKVDDDKCNDSKCDYSKVDTSKVDTRLVTGFNEKVS